MSTMLNVPQTQGPVDYTINLQDLTINEKPISTLQKELDFGGLQPPHMVIRLLPDAAGEAKKNHRQIIAFSGFNKQQMHTWVVSENPAESLKVLLVCGKNRKDKYRYMVHCREPVDMEKLQALLRLHGTVHLYKCIAPRIPTTPDELRNVDIDASWQPIARELQERTKVVIDPVVSTGGSRPAVLGSSGEAEANTAGESSGASRVETSEGGGIQG